MLTKTKEQVSTGEACLNQNPFSPPFDSMPLLHIAMHTNDCKGETEYRSGIILYTAAFVCELK